MILISSNYEFKLQLWGRYACFTRPELKSERYSYEIPTYSALRNIIQSIYWKPEIEIEIKSCAVLNPIKKVSVRTNNIKSKVVYGSAKQGKTIDMESDRTQRNAIILKDVAYLVRFSIQAKPEDQASIHKHLDIMGRRIRKGQCFQQPYFGCREYIAHFSEPTGDETPIQESIPFGLMLHDFDWSDPAKPKPIFKNIVMRNGVIDYAS